MKISGLLFVAMAVGVGAMGVVGCDGDDDGSSGDTTTTTSATTTTTTTTTTATMTGGGQGGMGQGGMGQGGMGGAGGAGGSMANMIQFRLAGTQYNPHAGATVYVRLMPAGGQFVDIGNAVVGNNGTFEITGMIMADTEYTGAYWADVNGNQACDAAPTDHVWDLTVNASTADVEMDVTHNVNFGTCPN